jgi:hypothetical protein
MNIGLIVIAILVNVVLIWICNRIEETILGNNEEDE